VYMCVCVCCVVCSLSRERERERERGIEGGANRRMCELLLFFSNRLHTFVGEWRPRCQVRHATVQCKTMLWLLVSPWVGASVERSERKDRFLVSCAFSPSPSPSPSGLSLPLPLYCPHCNIRGICNSTTLLRLVMAVGSLER
jgi:hypothetical protein